VLDAAAYSLSRHAEHLYERRYANLIVEPIFAGRGITVEDDLAFVLMPFTQPWSDRIWTRYIRPTLEGVGMRGMRADDLFGRDVVEDIWAGILRSRVVVADITGRNANVFYELGLAHTVGKDVVLLTQSTDDIPFDLNRFRHIIYQDNADGYDTLTAGLKETVTHILSQ
jgi:hypothetical protein